MDTSLNSRGTASATAHDKGCDHSSSDSRSVNRRSINRQTDTTLSDAATLAESSTRSSTSPSKKASPSTAGASCSARTLAPSPLDNINPKLYVRFPRFSTTTEISQPDLSLEDVASTRFSADEEAILPVIYSRNNERYCTKTLRLGRAARKLISHQSTLLKRASLGIKHVPSSLGLAGKFQEKAAQSSAREVQNNVRLSLEIEFDPQTQQPSPSRPQNRSKNNRDVLYRTVTKLSALEEHRSSFEDRAQSTQVDEATKPLREPATHFPPNTAPYKFPASTNNIELCGYAYERPPLRRSSLAATGQHLPRSFSYGSVSATDLRYYPFAHGPDRLTSFSNPSSRQTSLNSLNQTISSRPYSRPVSARNIDEHRMVPQLQRDIVFVDMPQPQNVDFLLPSQSHPGPGSSRQSLASRPQSGTTSYYGINQDENQHLRVKSGCSIDPFQIQKTHHKMPLFVPKEIKKDGLQGIRHCSRHCLPPRSNSLTGFDHGATTGENELSSEELKRALSECSMLCLPSENDHEDGALDLELSERGTIMLSPKIQKRGNFAEIVTNMKTRNFWFAKNELPKTSFGKSCGSRLRKIQDAIRGRGGEVQTDSDEGE